MRVRTIDHDGQIAPPAGDLVQPLARLLLRAVLEVPGRGQGRRHQRPRQAVLPAQHVDEHHLLPRGNGPGQRGRRHRIGPRYRRRRRRMHLALSQLVGRLHSEVAGFKGKDLRIDAAGIRLRLLLIGLRLRLRLDIDHRRLRLLVRLRLRRHPRLLVGPEGPAKVVPSRRRGLPLGRQLHRRRRLTAIERPAEPAAARHGRRLLLLHRSGRVEGSAEPALRARRRSGQSRDHTENRPHEHGANPGHGVRSSRNRLVSGYRRHTGSHARRPTSLRWATGSS